MEKINIKDKLKLINEYWSPKIVGEINNSYIKLAKFNGEFSWHKHNEEDEMFMVVKGNLTIQFKERNVNLSAGEFIIIPKGIEHFPKADGEVEVMLFELKSTLNTGNVINEKTVENLEWI